MTAPEIARVQEQKRDGSNPPVVVGEQSGDAGRAGGLLNLQQSAGNRAVASLIGAQRAPAGDAGKPSAEPIAEAEKRLVEARAARAAADALVRAPINPGPGETDMDVWVARAPLAVSAANARLAEAHAANDLAKLRVKAGPESGPEHARLGREAAEANAKVGDAESALGQAMTQAVRARRVGEGLAMMRGIAIPGGGPTGGPPVGGGAPPGGAPVGGADAHSGGASPAPKSPAGAPAPQSPPIVAVSAPTNVGSEDEGDFDVAAPAPRRRRPPGMKDAIPATVEEAQGAYGTDPKKVHRSLNDSLHRQYWELDSPKGTRPPPVFKSGNTYIVGPDLDGPSLPPLHQEPIEADEEMEARGVRALGQHLDSRKKSGSGGPGPAPSEPIAGPVAGPTIAGPKPTAASQTWQSPPGVLGDADRPPPTDLTAAELGIVPGSKQDTPIGRANRAEQLRRAAANQLDQVSVQGGKQPYEGGAVSEGTTADPRARARAADYASVYTGWAALGRAGRADRIRNIINAHLAREGIPPVEVVFGEKKPGHAEFDAANWKMALSAKAVEATEISMSDFASLTDNAVHETQHVVTTFRGLRVALADKQVNPRVYIPDHVVDEAKAANSRRDINLELDQTAIGEAREIYQLSVEPDRALGVKVPTGGVDRAAVLKAKDDTRKEFEAARALYLFNIDERAKDPADPELQRNVAESGAALQRAGGAMTAAHNAYIALAEETFSWRQGSAVKNAVTERLLLEADLAHAKEGATEAEDDRMRLLRAGDMRGTADASRRKRESQEQADQLSAHIARLTKADADLSGGRSEREEPLAEAEIKHAPVPAERDDRFGLHPPRKTPKPAQSAPFDLGTEASTAKTSGPPVQKPGAPMTTPISTGTMHEEAGPAEEGGAQVRPPTVSAGKATAKPVKLVDKPSGTGAAPANEEQPEDERSRGAIAGGGDLIGAEKRKVVTDQRGGKPVATTAVSKIALRPDGTIAAGGELIQEKVIGTDPNGQPIKVARGASGGVNLSEKGATAHGAISQTNAAGGKHSLGGAVTVDPSGNVSAQLSYSYLTKSGMSFTPSVSSSYQAQASDPIKLDGGKFAVTFAITETQGAAFGAGKQFSAGPSASVDFGTTTGTLDTGTKVFDDEAKAKEFSKHAAMYVERERMGDQKPPSTVDGALAIPVGETRGSGQLSGTSIGGSVAFEGASLGIGHHSTDIQQFEVTHVSKDIFRAKGTMTGTKGTDVTLSGGIGLARGGSTTKSFAVTWEFNLSTTSGKAAFEQYARTLVPPFGTAKLVGTEALDSEEDHDSVSIPLLGTAVWSGSTWELTRTDEKGTHVDIGGEQSRNQDPSWIGKHVFDQDEIHSRAQIVGHLENGREAGFEAQLTVKSDSGEVNRETFGEIFMGVPHQGTAKQSGDWNLSAVIDPKVVHQLERNSKEFRNASTKEEKLRIYAKFVKDNGAGMLGGQVRSGDDPLAWNLELKGDKNFPGVAGRDELERKRADLKERLRTDPANAKAVVTEAQATLKSLHGRREAVAEKKNYTDLPDELRDEQVKLIDKHIADFEFISHKASQEAVKAAPGEKVESTRARIADKGGYKDAQASADAIDLAKLRDRIADKEGMIHDIDPKILEAIGAVQQAQSHTRQMSPWQAPLASQRRADYNLHWSIGSNVNDKQIAMAPKADALRLKLLEDHPPAELKEPASALLAQLTERYGLLTVLLSEVTEAAVALKPVTTKNGMAGHEKFWAVIKADDLPGSSEEDG